MLIKTILPMVALGLFSTTSCTQQDDGALRTVTAEREVLRQELDKTRAELDAARKEGDRAAALDSENQNLKREIDELNKRIADLERNSSSRLSQRGSGTARNPGRATESRTPTGGARVTPTPAGEDVRSLRDSLRGGSGSK